MPDPWAQVKPVLLPLDAVKVLCQRRYPGHPRGCPNFGKKPGCPPAAPRLSETLDLGRPVWAIFNGFDLAGHVTRMRGKHPKWSDRQLCCCLYWQPRARKDLRAKIAAFLAEHPEGLNIITTPEAQGVDVTATMRQAGVVLQWPPAAVAFQVVLAGYPHAWCPAPKRIGRALRPAIYQDMTEPGPGEAPLFAETNP